MQKRLLYGLGAVLLIVCAALVIWQGDFPGSFGSFAPDNPEQTFVFYGISILIFLLMIALGFMIVRLMVKIWIERQSDRIGSRIKTKLVAGALALSLMPVFFMVLFNFYALNATLSKWFSRPVEHELVDFGTIARALKQQTLDNANALAELLASSPDTKLLIEGNAADRGWLARFCSAHGIMGASIQRNEHIVARCGNLPRPDDRPAVIARAPVAPAGAGHATVTVAVAVPIDVVRQQQMIRNYDREYQKLSADRKLVRSQYLWIMTLIAIFVLFFATWLAQYLARQISGPITALLKAAREVSKGNLAYRVKVTAADELAQLVGGFNRMTADLEANRGELESRRLFTEAILESIPTGVISVDSAGIVLRTNKALEQILPGWQGPVSARLDELFSPEDAAEIRYLMNRARRTGHASRQLEINGPEKTLHLAVTVSAIHGRRDSGFVIVIEDTSDLLRAQKIAAWSEVARRVAHEIKNPLTPIMLSAERILRQVKRAALPVPADKIVRECAEVILEETASVKRLVDEFSQFARLPAAQPVLCDLNDVVASGIAVFEGRLEGIELQIDLASTVPAVLIDPEQFKRVVVNLIDNAAEAMQDSPARILSIQTRAGFADSVEIAFRDTGCGTTAEQKEKLFLPYFSTKGRGTGLGLAIVSHILTEHNASIRVEDNKPCGSLFTVEIPVAADRSVSAASAATALA